jgi:hypothetical protein
MENSVKRASGTTTATVASILAVLGWLFVLAMFVSGEHDNHMSYSAVTVVVVAALFMLPVLLARRFWNVDPYSGRLRGALLALALIYAAWVFVTALVGGFLFWPAAVALLTAVSFRMADGGRDSPLSHTRDGDAYGTGLFGTLRRFWNVGRF